MSPSAIVGLMLEIQSSLLQTPEHAHLSDAAEDLLLDLVRSIKNAETQTTTGADRGRTRGGASRHKRQAALADRERRLIRI